MVKQHRMKRNTLSKARGVTIWEKQLIHAALTEEEDTLQEEKCGVDVNFTKLKSPLLQNVNNSRRRRLKPVSLFTAATDLLIQW